VNAGICRWPYATVPDSYDREVVSSNPDRGCCVPTPTQHAIPTGSVNE